MNNSLKALFAFALIAFFGTTAVQAQRISAALNVNSYSPTITSPSGGTSIDYAGSLSGSLNLRYYTKEKWAYRVGFGVDNLNYSVTGTDINTNYDARRQDLKGTFGIEKHFNIAFLDVYPGVYIPVTVVGEDKLNNNLQNFQNGQVRAGLGVVGGAQIKLLKIFRVGVEFNATYDNFSTAVRESFNSTSTVPFQKMHYNTNFVVGIAL
ncbi:MAG: hypothetical protein AAFN10_02455 [Bacteroidota bacterium]